MRSPEARSRLPAAAFAVVALAWVGAHAAGVLGALSQNTFVVLGLAAIVTTVVGVRRFRPGHAWVFALIASALALFLVGGAVRVELGTLGDISAGRSFVPDLITMPGYLLFGVALGGIARARRGNGRVDLDATLDSVIASLAGLALAWAFLVVPALEQTGAPAYVRIVLSMYPALSVYLLALMLGIAFVSGNRPSSAQRLLVGAIAMMLVGDVVYMLVDARIADIPTKFVDVPYALAYVAYSTCMLHPTMRELVEPVPRPERRTRATRLAIVSASLAVPLVLTLFAPEESVADRRVLNAVVATMLALVIVRTYRALRDHARSAERLVHQATHDPLTGLPNRAYLDDHVRRALARQEGTDRCLALLFLDLDRFKVVNDSMGHATGDQLLVAVARRLRALVPGDNQVVRVGGDEFVIVLEGCRSADQAARVAERIRESFQTPFTVAGGDLYASASIGVAVAPPGTAASVGSLLRDADTAMYQAKDAGRDSVAVFDATMRDRAAQRLTLERDLREAVRTGALTLAYQPIVSVATGRAIGVEALLRWMHPKRGHVPPSQFVPIAEETGLIDEVGARVLDEACANVARWRRELPGQSDLFVSVNLSARQLRDAAIVERVGRALSEHGLDGSALVLELTESVLMMRSELNLEVLRRLRGLGVRVAIDDFGTGYSSLAYLGTFPVDEVKIDKSFVDGLDRDDTAQESLVAAITAMAGALGHTTVAEGVETARQFERLAGLGVDAAQGYLFARAVHAAEVASTLDRLRRQSAARDDASSVRARTA